jgi:hypothetical protein
MKNILSIIFLSFFFLGFSQKKENKKIETSSKNIEILTQGLDNIVIENSESNFVEVMLFDENLNQHHVTLEENDKILKVGFKIESIIEEETIFRKYITKRLHRASAIIKIPKNKSVTFFGNTIDIESKGFKGDISIYIENGILRLNTIQANANIKLYTGTVYATLKNTNIDIISTIGIINVDKKVLQEKVYKKLINSEINVTISSVKANIFLTNL